jgi:N-acetyl-alpha-D-muramate 1-phosphate uridylyltransferase
MTTSPPRALILAAGRGERMRPLTDHTPKPLLRVHGKPLIEWHLEALARSGVRDVVINTAWLEEQFPAALGDGSRFGLSIRYSMEGRDHGGALETAGGIAKALPWLAPRGDEVFWVVSGDVYVPAFRFDANAAARFNASAQQAYLWMVPNAPHYPGGDFGIDEMSRLSYGADPTRTWASIGLFRPAMFASVEVGTKLKLRPLLDTAIERQLLSGELWSGEWADVGTIDRLTALKP